MQNKMNLLRYKMALQGLYSLNFKELSLFYRMDYRKVYKSPESFIWQEVGVIDSYKLS